MSKKKPTKKSNKAKSVTKDLELTTITVDFKGLMSIALSDRCKLIQLTDEDSGESVYQLVNTATLDTFFIRESTLGSLVEHASSILGRPSVKGHLSSKGK